jgi:hypothetical protein
MFLKIKKNDFFKFTFQIPAGHLSGELSFEESRRIFNDLESPRPTLKLLYVTPEKICGSAKFQVNIFLTTFFFNHHLQS